MRRKMSGRGADRFRNYGDVLQRHERELRLKKVLRVFSFVLVIMIVVMLIVMVVRIERRLVKKPKTASTFVDHRFR